MEDDEGSLSFDDEDEDLNIFGGVQDDKSDLNHRGDSCRCPCSAFSLFACFIFLFVFLLASSIILGLVLPFELGTVNHGSTQHFYNPGDTRIVDYNYIFCEKISLSTAGNNVNASLSAVSRQPELTKMHSFDLPTSVLLSPGSFREWHYHLHPGSMINVNVVACNQANLNRTRLVVLKGLNDFNGWTTGRTSEIYYSSVLYSSSSTCNPDDNQPVAIMVTEEDDYYFVITTDEIASAPTNYNITFDFTRTQLGSDNVEFSCTAGNGTTCSLDNFQHRWYILEVLKLSSEDYTTYVTVSTECLKRPVTFILIPIIPVVLFFAITFILFIPCCGICRREVKQIMKERAEIRAAASRDENGKRIIFRNRHITKTGELRYSIQKHSIHVPPMALAHPTAVGKASS